MKCLNPTCESVEADEINVSVNISRTEPVDDDIVYTGDTDNGDPSELIGTYCPDCDQSIYVPNWEEIVVAFVAADFMIVLSPDEVE